MSLPSIRYLLRKLREEQSPDVQFRVKFRPTAQQAISYFEPYFFETTASGHIRFWRPMLTSSTEGLL